MSLDLVIGCMYSGKSTELIRRVNRLKTIHKPYVIYNSSVDTRYGGIGVNTHNKIREPCVIVDNLINQLETEQFKSADTIFIEEAQFFNDLYRFVTLAVDTHHKKVVVIGLDGDSNRSIFGDITKLIPLCDNIMKLKALCSQCNDGTPGIFSKKICGSGEQIDVGTSDKYMAVCRLCYFK